MQQSTVLSKLTTWVLSVVLSTLLVACGGGGGGGTPANLKVTVDDTRILTVDDTLTVEYLGASVDDFKNKVAISVGGGAGGRTCSTNITPLMTFNGKVATVKLYALQSLLTVANGDRVLTSDNPYDPDWNCVSAEMDGSQPGTGKFAFTNTPELVINSVTGQTGVAGTTVHIDQLTYNAIYCDSTGTNCSMIITPKGVTDCVVSGSGYDCKWRDPNKTLTYNVPDTATSSSCTINTTQTAVSCDVTFSEAPEGSCQDAVGGGYECSVSGTVNYPQISDPLTVEGIARRAVLTSLEKLGGSVGAITAIAGETISKKFSVPNLMFAENTDDSQADFNFTVNDGSAPDFNLAIAGKTIVNAFAAQIHNIDSNHIISQWINDAVKSYLATISDTNSLVLIDDKDASTPSGLCNVLPHLREGSVMPTTGVYCRLEITKIDDGSVNVETTLNFDACDTDLTCDPSLKSAWQIKLSVQNTQELTGEAKVSIYNSADDSLLGSEDFTLGIKGTAGSSSTPSIKLLFNMGSTNAQMHVFQVDSPSYDSTNGWTDTKSLVLDEKISNFQYVTNSCGAVGAGWNCNGSGLENPTGPINSTAAPLIADGINRYVYRIARLYSINPSTALDDQLICDTTVTPNQDQYPDGCDDLAKADSADPWPWSVVGKEQHTPIVNSDKTEVISAVDSQVTDMRFATPSNAGFLSVSNSQKIQDTGIYKTALGTHFAGDAPASKVINGDLANNSDVSMAISSNWINQMLLSAFQSGKMKVDKTEKISELGDFSALLSSLNGIIDADDQVQMKVDFDNAPYIQYVNGYAELVAHNVHIGLEVLKTIDPEAVAVTVVVKNDLGLVCPALGLSPYNNSDGHSVCDLSLKVKNFIQNLNGAGHVWLTMTADVKARLKPLVDNKILSLSKGDMMLDVTDADGVIIKLNHSNDSVKSQMISEVQAQLRDAGIFATVAEDGTILDPTKPTPTDMSALLAGTIQQQLQQLLDQQSFIKTEFTLGEPTGTGLPATLRSLFENFFCENTGGTLVAKSRALELVADDIAFDVAVNNHDSNEAANMIIAASLIEKPDPSNSNAVLDLDLHYEGCASP